MLTAISGMLVRHVFTSGLALEDGSWPIVGVIASLGFIAWGPLIGAATLAYYHRRRDSCSTCGLD